MKDDQVTLRLPRATAALLAERARERGVVKSQIVREALEAYIVAPAPMNADAAWARVAPLVGSLSLDRAASHRDALAKRIRQHNWRAK